jgi:hypothetical protein
VQEWHLCTLRIGNAPQQLDNLQLIISQTAHQHFINYHTCTFMKSKSQPWLSFEVAKVMYTVHQRYTIKVMLQETNLYSTKQLRTQHVHAQAGCCTI